MKHFTAEDGRILTPPHELEPLLQGSFPAFSQLLGHIRFFYLADEIWDGKSSLVFTVGGEPLAAVALDDGCFYVQIANEAYRIADGASTDAVFEALQKTVPAAWRRPSAQLAANPDPHAFPCGYRCDMCLVNKKFNENDFSGSEKFAYMDSLCYHDASTRRNNQNRYVCPGCNLNNNRFCRSYTCSKEKGYANCAECGGYHTCDVYRGSHFAGQCNLGITAEEVTCLAVPYCMKERLDFIRKMQAISHI